jgi:hypothetical protein
MRELEQRRWLILNLLLSLLIGACAKRPASFQASAPAPSQERQRRRQRCLGKPVQAHFLTEPG